MEQIIARVMRLVAVCIVAVVLAFALSQCTGCSPYAPIKTDEYVYKYNPIERQYQLADPESRLRYNVFEREWQFAR